MKHEPTLRIVPGADTAVLFLHGICGTPDHFRKILPLESHVPREWSVYNLVMDGHGSSVEAFSHSSMNRWKTQVWSVFEKLSATHERIILVAHSMGTLFSIQLALEFPEKVSELFLLAVPIPVRLRLFGIRNILRVAFDRLDEKDPVLMATYRACGIQTTKKLWKYIPWSARMLELLCECAKTRKCLGQLTVPCIAFQSRLDEMVSARSVHLLRDHSNMQVRTLEHSTHFYYAPEDVETVLHSFESTIKNK